MNVIEFLHSVWQDRFPFYLSKDQAIEIFNKTPERDIELYNTAIEDFIDTWEIKDKEILKYAINYMLLLIHATSWQEQVIE